MDDARGATPPESQKQTIAAWRAVLVQVADLGVPWEATRFADYLRIMERLLAAEESRDRPSSMAAFRRDGRNLEMLFEGAGQLMQLGMAARKWKDLDQRVLRKKLETVLGGTALPLRSADADHPRDTLVELVSVPILAEYGFTTEITENGPDILLRNDEYERVIVECKRPTSLGNALSKIRSQMWKRTKVDPDPASDRRHLGLAVIAVESALDIPAVLLRARSEADVDRGADALIERAKRIAHRFDRQKNGKYRLWPVTPVVFFVLHGAAILDRDESSPVTLYTFVRSAPVPTGLPVPSALDRILASGGSGDVLSGFRIR
jgi:hypothetical protein